MARAPSSTKRRTKTKAPGVYRSRSGRYEIAYRDSDGRLVFRVVEGGLEDAKAERADVIGKLCRGEPVRRTKATFGEFAKTVMEGLNARPRTLEKHEYHLNAHLLPRFRNRKLADITTDDVARLVAEMTRGVRFERVDDRLVRKSTRGKDPAGNDKGGFAGSTITGTVSTLSLVLGKAKRKGLIPANPCIELEKDERPKLTRPEKRVLTDAEIASLLAKADGFRPLVALLVFSGLRLGEALGLCWSDVGGGYVRVRRQLGRDRKPAEIKTAAGRRDVVLIPQLAAVLAAHRLASLHSGDSDYVFPAPDGSGRDHRSTAKGIERAVKRAKLGDGISAHSFRHTFASQLIVGHGEDPVRVSRQLGHTSPAFTAATYAHLFEQARHADDLRERMANGYGKLLADVNALSTEARNEPQPDAAPVASIARIRG